MRQQAPARFARRRHTSTWCRGRCRWQIRTQPSARQASRPRALRHANSRLHSLRVFISASHAAGQKERTRLRFLRPSKVTRHCNKDQRTKESSATWAGSSFRMFRGRPHGRLQACRWAHGPGTDSEAGGGPRRQSSTGSEQASYRPDLAQYRPLAAVMTDQGPLFASAAGPRHYACLPRGLATPGHNSAQSDRPWQSHHGPHLVHSQAPHP